MTGEETKTETETGPGDPDRRARPARSREQLRALFDGAPGAVLVHDGDGRIVDANERAVRTLGYGRERLRSMTVADLDAATDPEALRRIWADLAADETHERETVYRLADGTTTPVEVWLTRTPLDGDDRYVAVARDMSDRVARERELRTLSEEYEAMFTSAEDAVFLVDVEGPPDDPTFRYERLNPAHERQTGLQTGDLRGQTPREAFGDDLGARLAANYRRCVDARETVTYEETLPMPAGDRVWQTKLSPVVVDGDVTRIVGVARDVTDRVERERELERRNARLDEFASVISHDLRNPLNVATGRAALLAEICDSDHVAPLRRALDRMGDIIDDTLTLARQGESVGETDPVAVEALVGDCWDVVDTDAASLTVETAAAVEADRDRLRHVFENLFRNAVEHGGPDVTVRVGREGDRLYVADDGPGVAPDDREQAFEAGYSTTNDGTGFGLAIVRRIAEAHGWRVTLAESADGGTRVEFDGVAFVD